VDHAYSRALGGDEADYLHVHSDEGVIVVKAQPAHWDSHSQPHMAHLYHPFPSHFLYLFVQIQVQSPSLDLSGSLDFEIGIVGIANKLHLQVEADLDSLRWLDLVEREKALLELLKVGVMYRS